ncbi:hypothetical protein [Streptomyces sp. NPDC047974]|uniref:hypothetical protein n=1 Tax=Streptomyces sp. NPDC047974 TaxID=3154343 RepID=UPI0033C0E091
MVTDPPYPEPARELAGRIRTALREMATEFTLACDPVDLPSARDACAQHLGRLRRLPTNPPVEYRAEITLDLAADDQAAVSQLLAAQRRQTVADALRRQQTDALASELTEPAALLARWIEQGHTDWAGRPSTNTLEELAKTFARYRPEHERSVDHEALEVVREFLSSFPNLPEKQMLYTILASGMRHAGRPDHAAKTESLLGSHAPPTRSDRE